VSVVRPVLLRCDECSEISEISETIAGPTYSVREARTTMRRYGWTRQGGRDLCKPCTVGKRIGQPVSMDPDGRLYTRDGKEVR